MWGQIWRVVGMLVALNSQKLDKIAENHAEIYHVLGPNFGPWISHIFKTWYTKKT